MAGSSVAGLRNCTPSYPDNSYVQLQLMVSPEATAAGLSSSSPLRRKSRGRISAVGSTAKLLLRNDTDIEDSIHCGCKLQRWNRGRIRIACAVPPPCGCYDVALVMETWQCSQKRKNQSRMSVLCDAAKPMLDHCSNDVDDVTSSSESYWTEEVLSSLQRCLLESQWTLDSADSGLFTDGSSSLVDFTIPKTEEKTSSCVHTQHLGNTVVRSGQASARHRRLAARSRSNSVRCRNSHTSCKAVNFSIPAKLPDKIKRRKVKCDSVQDFFASFLKPANGCGMFTKHQEKGLTKHMRACQNLEKARNQLKQKLGYDPPYELWAASVNMSIGELLSMVKEGEIARNKLMSSHLRLVVSVAKAYQNLGVDMADLVLEGSRGLLRGLEKFDHRKGYKMSTYVHWWIRQGVTRAIADHSRLVRVPVYLHEIMFAIRGARNLLNHHGKPATVENLSLVLNVPTYRIRRALKAKSKALSLDKSDGSYGLKREFNSLHEFVADPKGAHHPSGMLIEEDLIGTVRDRLALLNPREQNIIRWVYGIDTEDGARSSLTAIALKFGISKERVRQIKANALSKMRLKERGGNAQLLLADLQDRF